MTIALIQNFMVAKGVKGFLNPSIIFIPFPALSEQITCAAQIKPIRPKYSF